MEPYLKYTLCFCRYGELLLMLYRQRPPHQGEWNGVGGKIEPGETPRAGVHREVREETGIDLRGATRLRFGGIVTWPPDFSTNGVGGGMYVYVADLPHPSPVWAGDRPCADGLLCWKPVAWACEPGNKGVVANIPYFLPPMLNGRRPVEHSCAYHDDVLERVVQRPLLEATDRDEADHDEDDAGDAPR